MSRVWRSDRIIEDAIGRDWQDELVFNFENASNAPPTLPANIGNVHQLTNLIIENSRRFTTIPDEVGQLALLQYLVVVRTSVRTLPDSLIGLTNLTFLCLQNNALTEIPVVVRNMTQLVTLDLSENAELVVHLEDDNVQPNWPALEDLSLGNLRLTSVPEWVWKLSSLTSLDLTDNNLTELSPDVQRLTNLQSLSVWRNAGLTTLPNQLGRLRNLQFVYWYEDTDQEQQMRRRVQELLRRGRTQHRWAQNVARQYRELLILYRTQGRNGLQTLDPHGTMHEVMKRTQ